MSNGFEGGGARNGRGRGRAFWPQAEGAPRQLRRPHAAVQVAADQATEKPKYTLSPEAKEWFPPNYGVPTPQSIGVLTTYPVESNYTSSGRFSVQNRLHMNQAIDPYDFSDMSHGLEIDDDPVLRESITELINVMCEVTFCPGKFDVLCGPLVDTFASTLHDETYTRLLVDAIVNQSIAEPNFRYNGARLCSMYDSIAAPDESVFRPCLLERCTAEEDKIVGGGESVEENMRGFAMFLAEIYTQLEDTQTGGRVKSLGDSLCKVLLHLLDTKEAGSVKAVCQLLKLSGIALDADCPQGMRAAFERLQQLQHVEAVRNVLSLRQNRWGVSDAGMLLQHSDSLSNGDSSASSSVGNPNDSIYMPDGHALTAEETTFLQSACAENKPAPDDDDILEELETDNWEAGMMDPEMQKGFLEFLKMSNQIKQ